MLNNAEFKVNLDIYADRGAFKGNEEDLEDLIIDLLEKNGLSCQIYDITEQEW